VTIPATELKRLFARSGNRCAFSDCRRVLVVEGPSGEQPVILGDVAHIVAASPAGPRGDPFMVPANRNRYENLILLCNTHHQLIDDQVATYTPERLRAMKADHEGWIENRLAQGIPERPAAVEHREDELYSTLLPVDRMPSRVFSAPARFKTEQETKAQLGPLRGREVAPFILRGNMLFAFQDLRLKGNPFQPVISGGAELHPVSNWLEDPDRSRWLVDLLNRGLNKLTGRRGLSLDKDHHRYYFPMSEPGEPRTVSYRPLNAKKATRAVVWQPTRKLTGEPKKHWLHLAVALRFVRIEAAAWCLSVRPELRITVDGVKPYASHAIGLRITRKKARLFNYDLLGDVQFWRDYLSGSSPRIVLPFGPKVERLVVLTDLMQGTVSWPGIPPEHDMPFRNIAYVDDLLSWAEAELPESEGELGEAEWEEAEDDQHG
jgi:HNH endonuclease